MRQRTDGRGLATRAIHAGERPDPTTHAHRTPIYATATFTFDSAADKEDAVDRALAWEPGAYFYSRTGNPTNRALEEKIASLEGAEDAVVSSSGMAAESNVNVAVA
jgi:methionine-gamma-lyase